MITNDVYNNHQDAQLLKRYILVAFFVTLISFSARISFPFPFTPVPVTLQTLFVLLAGLLLGPVDAFLALVIYLVIGAAGVPVFSKGAGVAYLLGPTGGFLISFPMAAFMCGFIFKNAGFRIWGAIIGSVLALILIYALGAMQLAVVMKKSFLASLTLAVFPFIPADIAKAVVAVIVASSIKRRLQV